MRKLFSTVAAVAFGAAAILGAGAASAEQSIAIRTVLLFNMDDPLEVEARKPRATVRTPARRGAPGRARMASG